MLSNIANSVTTLLFNYQFYKYYLSTGVDSITIVLYFQFLVSSMIFGFSTGVAPIISYKYGEKQLDELLKIKKSSFIIFTVLSLICFISSLFLIYPVANIFSGGDASVYKLTVENYFYFSFSILFMGVSIFASSYFTAVEDGKTSLIISSLRTLVFLSCSLIILPLLIGEIGVWVATSFAELLGAIISLLFILKKKVSKITFKQ